MNQKDAFCYWKNGLASSAYPCNFHAKHLQEPSKNR